MNNEGLTFGKQTNTSIYFAQSSNAKKRNQEKEIPMKISSVSRHRKKDKKNIHTDDTDNPHKKFKESPSNVSHTGQIHDNEVTPLLEQVFNIKDNNPSLLLFIECGYKYRFFGNDAKTVNRELNIATSSHHGTLTASVPTHRLHVHVKRLVKKGYKVGVVNQTEVDLDTGQSGIKSLPFARKLTGIYTRATLVGEHISPIDDDFVEVSGPLMVILEENASNTSRKIAIVVINVAVGQIFINEESNQAEVLVSLLERYQPVEFLVPEDLSSATKMTITSYVSCQPDGVRLETYNSTDMDYSASLYELTSFLKDDTILNRLSSLSKAALCCVYAACQYLKEFGLQSVFSTLRSRDENESFMKLPSATLRNLEMVRNSYDGGIKYSLYWILNRTATKFGARMLHSWILNPLMDVERIKERQDVIEEFIYSDSHVIHGIKNIVQKLPDLESSLVAIFYKKCSPLKFYTTVESLNAVYDGLRSLFWRAECWEAVKSLKLKEIAQEIINKLKNIEGVINSFNPEAARQNKKSDILLDWSKFPKVQQLRERIGDILKRLNDIRPLMAKKLNMDDVCYSTFYGEEFLIELKIAESFLVPHDWQLVCSSKSLKRFRSPEVLKLYKELQQVRKELEVQCNEAWMVILDEFLSHFYQYKSAVDWLAALDALISLANVSSLNGYAKPTFDTVTNEILIEGGRHPIVSVIKTGDEPFIANSTCMKADEARVVILTGPNMGGKSCYMKQVALICAMAQMGCFVPADSASLPILDGVYVRMGASDEIGFGRSTFMVEASETAEIIHSATDKSLVILDEFGRGTSSCDGVALAFAVLEYFIQLGCFTIFVTHYIKICEFEASFPRTVINYHMAYVVIEGEPDSAESVAFLYQLAAGKAESSYGLNVARLSGIPSSVVARAAVKARIQEKTANRKQVLRKAFVQIFTKTTNLRREIQNISNF